MTFMAGQQALLMHSVPATDPYAAFVKALLHFDGDLSDSAAGGAVFSLLDNAVLTATDQLTGSGALDCRDLTGVNGVSSTAHISLALGTSDWCVEMFVKDTGIGGTNKWVFFLEGSAGTISFWEVSGGWRINGDILSATPPFFAAPTPDVWHHLAISRSGNSGTVWLNGASQQTFDVTGVNYGTGNATLYLGRSSGGGDYRLLIDEFRLTVGTPRYTTAFTPSYPFLNPASGLTLPYTLTFNQADKAAMVAFYASEGITISPLADGDAYTGGVLILTDNYDDFGFTTPTDPVGGGAGTMYIRVNGFGITLPQDFTVELPSGTQAKRVSFDFWSNGTSGANDIELRVTFSDTSVSTRTISVNASGQPFTALSAPFPVSPPGGSVYITEVAIRQLNTNENVWALDNMVFSA